MTLEELSFLGNLINMVKDYQKFKIKNKEAIKRDARRGRGSGDVFLKEYENWREFFDKTHSIRNICPYLWCAKSRTNSLEEKVLRDISMDNIENRCDEYLGCSDCALSHLEEIIFNLNEESGDTLCL